MKQSLNLFSSNQVRELDRIAINDFSIAGIDLMTRAGQATFETIQEAYPNIKNICVICGAGNNGGDGYIVATLAISAGLSVTLISPPIVDSIKGDALLARQSFLSAGGKESAFDNANLALLNSDIIVDAIFGTGLSRDIEGHWKKIIERINTCSSSKIIAIDIPSGLDANTGNIHGICVKADITVTYIGLKSGLFTGQARDYTGKIVFDDLAVPQEVYSQLNEKADKQLISQYCYELLKPRSRCSHKGTYGHVLLIGGAAGMSGAIRLAGEAALRTGAGLVSIATATSHAELINLTRPELMTTGIEQADALSPLIDKASVIVIGPGLGQSDWAKDLLQKVLESEKPKVLDADALNLLSQASKNISEVANNNWILTPHPAEAARLLGVSTKEIEADRYQSIKKIVKKWGGGSILKGAGSLVFDGEITYVCNTGNPGMASGGMGDVLSGVVAALITQGLSLSEAAYLGSQIHADAADLAAKEGERGLLASDLFPYLRKLVNRSQMSDKK